MIARLGPGVRLDQAQHRLQVVGADLANRFPESNRGSISASGRDDPRRLTVIRHSQLDPALRIRVALVSFVMLGATALVLLSACANAGSLLLSRATSRGREIAVRFALGATRGRLLKLLLTESLLVSMLGGALGCSSRPGPLAVFRRSFHPSTHRCSRRISIPSRSPRPC